MAMEGKYTTKHGVILENAYLKVNSGNADCMGELISRFKNDIEAVSS